MSYSGKWHGTEFEDNRLIAIDKELSREDCNPDVVEETAVIVKETSTTEEKAPALDYSSKDDRKAKAPHSLWK